MTSIKTGADHLRSLQDGRTVWLDGKPVGDVTVHPAFRNAVATACRLYDFQAAHVELMTFPLGDGRRVNRAWQMPRSYAELVQRRRALEAWAGVHCGFMGRSPDHVASSLIGQMMGIEVFRRHGEARARALTDYVDHARRNDLYLTYVIVNPQADRSKAWGAQDEGLVARIVDEDAGGITIRGGKMLGTSAVLANEVLVANLQPLQKGEEELAFSCTLSMNARGLRVLSRKSYEGHAVSRFDNPLASVFDENDALLYFEDVKVPWDRVFVCRDTDMCRAQFHDTPGHVMQNYQAQIRLTVKIRFLVGVARKIAETIGTISMPPVRETLGRLAAQAAMVEAMLHGMEAAGSQVGEYFVPHKHHMYAAQVLTQELYPKLIETIRGLAGGSLIMLPGSAADFANPELAKIIDRTQRSPAMPPIERVKFLKAAWDALGSEFASRHLQYEMFYAGAPFVTCAHSFRTYDWNAATGMVDALMAGMNHRPREDRMGKLDGKVAIVTGASRGIGAAIAELFAIEGAKVVCAARTLHEGGHRLEGSLDRTVANIRANGGEAMAVTADVSGEADCLTLVEQARAAYGPIHVLVNNAALNYYIPTVDYPTNRWVRAFAVNVHGPFMLSKAVLPDMIAKSAGAIINISSGAAIGPGHGPYQDQTARGGVLYGATKAALERFTQGLAQEVSQYGGITIAAVSPSRVVPTPGTVFHKLVSGLDDPRGEPPSLMARAALLLASEPAAKVNGRVTYSQQILKEYGWIDKAGGRGVDFPGSGYSQM